jgi:Right handed beta helix region
MLSQSRGHAAAGRNAANHPRPVAAEGGGRAKATIRRANTVFVLALLAGAIAAGMFTSSARAAGCDKYASPSGSDSNNGSGGHPYRTPARLDSSLRPGQIGCLETGSYGSVSASHRFTNSGTPSGQITITAAPGDTATVIGLVQLEGAYTTLSDLNIDGSNTAYATERSGTTCPYPVSNGLEIDGQGDIFEQNNFYQSVASLRGNGIGVGWNGQADHAIIRYNRIHDVGGCDDYDQLIYLDRGNGVQIYGNWMWNDPHGWGVQLYPDAVGAHVYDNVIDSAGSGFVVAGSSTGNVIDRNVVLNSTGLITSGLSQGVGISEFEPGSGNTFTGNDVFNNPGGVGSDPDLLLSANITRNPSLVNPRAHDYGVAPGSPLAGWGLWNGDVPALAQAANVRNGRHAHQRVSRHKRRQPRATAQKRRRRRARAHKHRRRNRRAPAH